MKPITIRELHASTGKWVRKAGEVGEVLVTDRGRIVAKIIPAADAPAEPYFGRRKLTRAFRAASPYLVGGVDSTIGISEERDREIPMIYFDTSYLVRLYFGDPGWEKVRELSATDQVACGWHGYAETVAAFHRKFREGSIRPNHYQALLGQFTTDNGAGAYRWFPQTQETAERAAQVYAKLPASVYLRAADAWHLATAALQGLAAIYSHDAKLLAAAAHFGLEGRNVVPA